MWSGRLVGLSLKRLYSNPITMPSAICEDASHEVSFMRDADAVLAPMTSFHSDAQRTGHLIRSGHLGDVGYYTIRYDNYQRVLPRDVGVR